MSNDNTPEMNTNTEAIPMMRRQTMAGADETLPVLPTSPLLRQRAVPVVADLDLSGSPLGDSRTLEERLTAYVNGKVHPYIRYSAPAETVSDGDMDPALRNLLSERIVTVHPDDDMAIIRNLLSERIVTVPADISGSAAHPFIRPSLPQEPQRFNGLSEREGYADYVETSYHAAVRADVIADLAAVPSLVGVPITEMDRLVGPDIVSRIRAVMSRFTPDYGTNLYYGALVHLVNAAKEDMAAAAAAGVEEESDVDSDNEGDGHEVSGTGGNEDEEEEDGDEDEEEEDGDEDEEEEDGDEDGTDADDEGGDVEPVPAAEPAPPRRADNILDMPVAIELPVWGWVAVLAVFVAWAAFVNMALSRDLGVRVRPF
jgi:hypothetical protein